MRFITDRPADLQPGDVITALIFEFDKGRPESHPKQDWVVKVGWGPHPDMGNLCVQMRKLPNHPNYDLNLWKTDISGAKFEVERP